jgi:hypothetical protein
MKKQEKKPERCYWCGQLLGSYSVSAGSDKKFHIGECYRAWQEAQKIGTLTEEDILLS